MSASKIYEAVFLNKTITVEESIMDLYKINMQAVKVQIHDRRLPWSKRYELLQHLRLMEMQIEYLDKRFKKWSALRNETKK